MESVLNTMNCRKCGRKIVEQAKFCSYCGERQAIACQSCEALNAPDGQFCHDCGERLVGNQESSGPSSEGSTATPGGSECPRCRAVNEPGSVYCYQCGLPLESGHAESASPYARTQGHGQIDYIVSPQRVLIMSAISAGLYVFYWFYLTWRHYRDSTGHEAYPVWHALTLFVPIYNLFRTHAHMRVYKELMISHGLMTTISPGWAVAAILASNLLWLRALLLSLERQSTGAVLTQLDASVLALLSVASIAVVIYLLLHVQSNLNRYWSRIYPDTTPSSLSFVEVVIAVVGVVVWIDTIALIVSESYRLGL